MKSTRYLLIGGGLASSQAAKQLREHDPQGSITLVGKEPHVSYDRPPLSKEFMAGAQNKYDLLTYVCSDIFDLHLEFAGDESEQDRVLLRGRLENKSFTFLYLKQNVLMAYFAVNTGSKEYPVLQRLIRQKKNLAGTEAKLQDAAFAIKELL